MKKNIFYKREIVTTYIRYTLGIFLLIGIHSCDLRENPIAKYDIDNYYTSVDRLDLAVLRIYSAFQTPNSYTENYICAFDHDTDLSTVANGTSTGNYAGIAHYSFNPSYTQLDAFWKTMYSGINYANEVLHYAERVPVKNTTEKLKKAKLIGEAKFLRGYLYFELVRLFGDVPLKLDISTAHDEFKIPRVPKEDVYKQIVKDMEEAIPALPWYYEDSKIMSRPTKNSVLGALARVQLFRGGYSLYQDGQIHRPVNYTEYYQKVDSLTKVLITSGRNELNPNYEQVFKNQCQSIYDLKEDLFQIDIVYEVGKYGVSRFGIVNGTTVSKAGVYNTNYNLYVNTQGFAYSYFEDTDLRRNVSISTFKYDEKGLRVDIPGTASVTWTVGKWKREYQNSVDQLAANQTGINIGLLRYSDVLLMRAEALNELYGPTAEAYELVNMVRRRGYGKPITTPNTSVDMPIGLSKEDFLTYIQNERARELAFEVGIRRNDLIRWNILGDKILELHDYQLSNPDMMGTTVYDMVKFYNNGQTDPNFHMHELYPIPIRELQENSKLVQNPNYPQ